MTIIIKLLTIIGLVISTGLVIHMMRSKPVKMRELKTPVIYAFALSISTTLYTKLSDFILNSVFSNYLIFLNGVIIFFYIILFIIVKVEFDDYRKVKRISSMTEEELDNQL